MPLSSNHDCNDGEYDTSHLQCQSLASVQWESMAHSYQIQNAGFSVNFFERGIIV